MRKGIIELTRKENLPLLGGVIYCFCIPLFQTLATGAMILWLLLSLTNIAKISGKRMALLLPVALFLLYVISFALSPSDQYKILERKLSLIVFTLIFYFSSYSSEQRTLLLRSFVLGLILSGLACLALALFRSLELFEGALLFRPEVLSGKGFFESVLYGGNYFFGRYFSFFHQTVYYAIYLCLGIAVLIQNDRIVETKFQRWLFVGFFVFLIFLTSNKAGFLGLAVILFLFIIQNAEKLSVKVVLVVLLSGTSLLYIMANPRLNESFKKVFEGNLVLDKNARYGFSTRLLSWDASMNLIKKNPVAGYGVAHAQEVLDAEYKRLEYTFPLKEHLNAHNQFLQFWIESGVIGFILWALILAILFARALQFSSSNRYLILSFVVLLFINSLFESVMNRFSGISLISFFLCFLLSINKDET